MFHFPNNSHHDREMMLNLFMTAGTLTPYLEEKSYKFKMVLHERDFLGGRTIMSGIVDAINNSRRMIMVLSK